MARGFSLIEVLVASTLITIAIVTLAQLSVASIRWNHAAGSTTVATVVALQKMEQLRALTWTFDAAGAVVSDTATDVTAMPERPVGGRGLAASPVGALDQNTAGYFDFVDGNGGGASAPSGAVFVRRWSIDWLSSDTLLVQVSVRPVGTRRAGAPGRGIVEARLVTLRTRTTR